MQLSDDGDFRIRNHRVPRGEEFTDMIGLPGWDDQSLWGFENSGYWATLYRNDADHPDDQPDHQLLLPLSENWPSCVALRIHEAIGENPVSIIDAFGLAKPAAILRDRTAIEAELARHDGQQGACPHGQSYALNWVLGRRDRAPGSLCPWPNRLPTTDEVVAEHLFALAKTCRPDRFRDTYVGAENALHWCVNPEPPIAPH